MSYSPAGDTPCSESSHKYWNVSLELGNGWINKKETTEKKTWNGYLHVANNLIYHFTVMPCCLHTAFIKHSKAVSGKNICQHNEDTLKRHLAFMAQCNLL